ncbi:alpha/beta fold hydrolase [Mucilaginibacter aquaedulcis]|uniref:alpha/beta fold hydrolase n=1 Tax=Mucilaginibacter aquaedulcis TaxID=1187081 RepID=UPI0025B49321|nr:alpha/beta hydrolase [Mucilaginibacter aquaedulcis]MDN3551235.1 alpha/beta hydrolase [Mucilaginibacter aquaedulcis]
MKRLLCLLLLISSTALAQQNIMLSTYEYPYLVSYLELNSQHQQLKMAYMDVKPQRPNGQVVVLLHGKNFGGAYWKTTIAALSEEGYRVIAPDQIGFGKSSKPVGYQFTFQQLAINTKALLDKLGIKKIFLLGHSMGGMLSMRFTLMYPEIVAKLILEDPLGLEDWKRMAPYASIDSNYQKELKTDFASAKKYQQENYYHGSWKPEYDEWVKLQTAAVGDPQYPVVAMNNALTSDMIFTQPVIYELNLIKAPTLLIIGSLDKTAINRDLVKDPAVKAQMGNYPKIAKAAQQQIPGSQLVLIDGVGHLPHIEAFDRFIGPLEPFLKN